MILSPFTYSKPTKFTNNIITNDEDSIVPCRIVKFETRHLSQKRVVLLPIALKSSITPAVLNTFEMFYAPKPNNGAKFQAINTLLSSNNIPLLRQSTEIDDVDFQALSLTDRSLTRTNNNAMMHTKLYTTYELMHMALEYSRKHSPRDVWRAIQTQPHGIDWVLKTSSLGKPSTDQALILYSSASHQAILPAAHSPQTKALVKATPKSTVYRRRLNSSGVHLRLTLTCSNWVTRIESATELAIVFGPAPPSSSETSPRNSFGSTNPSPTKSSVTSISSQQTTSDNKESFDLDNEITDIKALGLFRGTPAHVLRKSYPPKGFFIQPSSYAENEALSRKIHDKVTQDRSLDNKALVQDADGNMVVPGDIPDMLRGIVSGDIGQLFESRGKCLIGTCTHIHDPCYPARQYLDLGKLTRMLGLKKDDFVHILLEVSGPCGILAHPPYNEIEVLGQAIGEMRIRGKNRQLTEEELTAHPYEHALEKFVLGCPVILHTSSPIVDFALDYRIQDVIRLTFECRPASDAQAHGPAE